MFYDLNLDGNLFMEYKKNGNPDIFDLIGSCLEGIKYIYFFGKNIFR